MITFNIPSLTEINQVADSFLNKFPDQRVFAFYGEMGIGKTTFIKALCSGLGVKDNVSSPSFAIINVYKADKEKLIYHIDFYRIKKIEEVFDLGYEDYFYCGNYCFIEWPEKISSLLPEETVRVNISKKTDNSRILSII